MIDPINVALACRREFECGQLAAYVDAVDDDRYVVLTYGREMAFAYPGRGAVVHPEAPGWLRAYI